MKLQHYLIFLVLVLAFSCSSGNRKDQFSSGNIFEYNDNSVPRWSSFENITAEKGNGAKQNNGAKGRPFEYIKAGESKTLLNVQEAGIINRIWITISDRSPEMLRSLTIEFFWDNEEKPAVSVPFGDFFGFGVGRMATYESALFTSPEGRSFICHIPMPFKKAAKVVVTNESSKPLSNLFFDINFQLVENWNDDFMYFHAYWHRDTATVLEQDFEILPAIQGKGRFIGTNVGINADTIYRKSWWGEGEVKIYLDGDKEFPTLAGTGTEDYIGTGWGQGAYYNQYSGCNVADDSASQWQYYRFHIPDPIYFKNDIKVAIQQIGGNSRKIVADMLKNGVKLVPITVSVDTGMHLIYQKGKIADLSKYGNENQWTNFYRSDDVSATAYFYLDKPSNELPKIQPVELRSKR